MLTMTKVVGIWRRHAVKYGNSIYVALPPAYLKGEKIEKNFELILELMSNGTITIRRAKNDKYF